MDYHNIINTRAAQNFKLNGKCIRHRDVFVWNGSWVFAQLFSYPYIWWTYTCYLRNLLLHL